MFAWRALAAELAALDLAGQPPARGQEWKGVADRSDQVQLRVVAAQHAQHVVLSSIQRSPALV